MLQLFPLRPVIAAVQLDRLVHNAHIQFMVRRDLREDLQNRLSKRAEVESARADDPQRNDLGVHDLVFQLNHSRASLRQRRKKPLLG